MFHATSRRHLMLHVGPPYRVHLTSHYTAVPVPRHHHFTSHLEARHVPHHTVTVHILHHSATIPHHTHIQHHSIFHTTPYSTSHYTTTSWFYLTPPHLTTHCSVMSNVENDAMCWNCGDKECGICNVRCDCSVSDVENDSTTHHIAYATFFITTIPHQQTFHITS